MILMKNKSIFERFLNEYHQKLVKVFCLKQLQQLLGIIGLSTAAIFIVARFIVIVEWKALILVASILACAFIGYKVFKASPTKRTTMKAYNDYIENDYVVTTYELDKNHPQYQAIRNKTEQLMEQKHAEILAIKQPILDKKWASIFVVCLFVSFLSYYLPSETQKTAIKQQEVNELVKETTEQLEELKQLTNDEEKK